MRPPTVRTRIARSVPVGIAAATLVLVLAAGCVPGSTTTTPDTPMAIIETADGEVRVRVEIAETPATRGRGLMFRDALEGDAGMVFLFEEDSTSAFHMENTRIPLSIAFFAADGTILRILDMVPCPGPPCPIYDPEVTYRGALEANVGAFERWGVLTGDRVRIVRP